MPEISDKVTGVWSLWRIVLDGGGTRAVRILPLFLSDDGRVSAPLRGSSGTVCWNSIQRAPSVVRRPWLVMSRQPLSRRADGGAEEAGRPLYDELVSTHRRGLDQENEKTKQAFASRRRAISALGFLKCGHIASSN